MATRLNKHYYYFYFRPTTAANTVFTRRQQSAPLRAADASVKRPSCSCSSAPNGVRPYTDKLPRFRLGLIRVVRGAVINRIADRLSLNNTTDVQYGRVQCADMQFTSDELCNRPGWKKEAHSIRLTSDYGSFK